MDILDIQYYEYSISTNDTIDNLISTDLIDNEKKIKFLGEYIKWKLSNPTKQTNTYPVINLLAGYYGLVTSCTLEEIKQMMSKAYSTEFINSVNKLTNLDIISGLLFINTMYVLTNNIQ